MNERRRAFVMEQQSWALGMSVREVPMQYLVVPLRGPTRRAGEENTMQWRAAV